MNRYKRLSKVINSYDEQTCSILSTHHRATLFDACFFCRCISSAHCSCAHEFISGLLLMQRTKYSDVMRCIAACRSRLSTTCFLHTHTCNSLFSMRLQFDFQIHIWFSDLSIFIISRISGFGVYAMADIQSMLL